MEAKDWILLAFPIFINGVVIFIFQNTISKKMERFTKRQTLRDEVVVLFWRKLQELNSIFIYVNAGVLKDVTTLSSGLESIKDKILEIIEY